MKRELDKRYYLALLRACAEYLTEQRTFDINIKYCDDIYPEVECLLVNRRPLGKLGVSRGNLETLAKEMESLPSILSAFECVERFVLDCAERAMTCRSGTSKMVETDLVFI